MTRVTRHIGHTGLTLTVMYRVINLSAMGFACFILKTKSKKEDALTWKKQPDLNFLFFFRTNNTFLMKDTIQATSRDQLINYTITC